MKVVDSIVTEEVRTADRFVKFPMQAVYGMHNWPGLPA